ncbi:SIR2 family protein [Clostridiaceae bacterium Marseille-Q4143]|nr:SIR2 family protein [Clostridiaceae bacterium Marseille-Q4143]
MGEKYLKYIPKTLQEDFIDNRVIPFVGAGFSKNAIAPEGASILDWDGLGKKVAAYIPDYIYTNAMDALSLFESEFSRTKLIEVLARELYVNQLKPGKTHRTFCDLYFGTICTTNFDFLIEQTLNEKQIPFSMIVSEERLPISTHETTKLIKLHGDFNHPERMVITEYDYDTYVEKNKILSTYISNLFITKTLLLVGYSFDDNDIRTLWQIIGSRLGKLSTPAYVVLVDASSIEIARFERRNIKVINLPGNKADYPNILNEFFTEIKQVIADKMPEQIMFTNEKASEELKMPEEDSRLCFISAPYQRLAFIKDLLYPTLYNNGISPITLDEAIMPGEIMTRKVDMLISKTAMAILDLSGNNAHIMWELGNIMSKNKPFIVIADENQVDSLPFKLKEIQLFKYSLYGDNERFINELSNFLKTHYKEKDEAENEKDYVRLFNKGEYNAAVIAAYRFLEITMSKRFVFDETSLMKSLNLLNTNNAEDKEALFKVKEYRKIRNSIVHENVMIGKKQAKDIISCVDRVCTSVNNGNIIVL